MAGRLSAIDLHAPTCDNWDDVLAPPLKRQNWAKFRRGYQAWKHYPHEAMMSNFEEIVFHFNAEGSLTKTSADELQSVRSEHAGIPEDYLRFLAVAGYGNLGDIQLYEGPTSAVTVYPNATGRLADILLIGDDFQGYCIGFDPTDSWRIVEVSPRGEIDTTVESEFLSLLNGYMQ